MDEGNDFLAGGTILWCIALSPILAPILACLGLCIVVGRVARAAGLRL